MNSALVIVALTAILALALGLATRRGVPGAMDGRRTRFRGTAGLPADGKLSISLSVAVRSRLCALSRQSRRRARPEGGGEMSARGAENKALHDSALADAAGQRLA